MLCLKQTDLVFYHRQWSLNNYCYHCYHALKSTIDPEERFILVNHSHITADEQKASKIFLCYKCERILYDITLTKFCDKCIPRRLMFQSLLRPRTNSDEQ